MKVGKVNVTIKLDRRCEREKMTQGWLLSFGSRYARTELPFVRMVKTVGLVMAGVRQQQELRFVHVKPDTSCCMCGDRLRDMVRWDWSWVELFGLRIYMQQPSVCRWSHRNRVSGCSYLVGVWEKIGEDQELSLGTPGRGQGDDEGPAKEMKKEQQLRKERNQERALSGSQVKNIFPKGRNVQLCQMLLTVQVRRDFGRTIRDVVSPFSLS